MFINTEESQLLDLIIQGYSNDKIAEILGYSESAVKKRLTKIYRKFSVANKIQLVNKLLAKLHTLTEVFSNTDEEYWAN